MESFVDGFYVFVFFGVLLCYKMWWFFVVWYVLVCWFFVGFFFVVFVFNSYFSIFRFLDIVESIFIMIICLYYFWSRCKFIGWNFGFIKYVYGFWVVCFCMIIRCKGSLKVVFLEIRRNCNDIIFFLIVFFWFVYVNNWWDCF